MLTKTPAQDEFTSVVSCSNRHVRERGLVVDLVGQVDPRYAAGERKRRILPAVFSFESLL